MLDEWLGKPKKSVLCHMLDVAGCAEILIQNHHFFQRLSQENRIALVVLVALHDIGKFSESFQSRINTGKKVRPSHWKLSDHLLLEGLDDLIGDALGTTLDARAELYGAVSGHHGQPRERPPRMHSKYNDATDAIGDRGRNAAIECTKKILELFPGGNLKDINEEYAKLLSWPLCGLTIASDWIGSNTEWFPSTGDTDISPEKYLEHAQKLAKIAVSKSGAQKEILVSQSSPLQIAKTEDLRPMQQSAAQISLPRGPVLTLIEDSTGTGKTEAALILAHRMMSKNKGRGIFFALPTMATANAMFERLAENILSIFECPPTLALIHSRAKTNPRFSKIIGGNARDSSADTDADCTGWLVDDRRRALLANVGVGTIDQALLGILPTRFAPLRQFGLNDKILIVDEAHSYEPYMEEELARLLEFHAALGGSAILVTATLPSCMRKKYITAYHSGLGRESPTLAHPPEYPCLSVFGMEANERRVKPAPESIRKINVCRLEKRDEAISKVMEMARSGAACAFVRNSVDEAISTAKEIRKSGITCQLLHARMALGDRLKRESEILEHFGRNGSSNGRKGKIVVGTQVIEASLDLDFDVMASDLAPIGSLVQRAGRLWRHMAQRPAKNRPTSEPALWVLSPDPEVVLNKNWLKDVLGWSAYVYDVNVLWRTANVLFREKSISEPYGLRKLIEAVHDENMQSDFPESLHEELFESEGRIQAERGRAGMNVVDFREGYMLGAKGKIWQDHEFPVRLGKKQATLVLAKKETDGIYPWHTDACECDPWVLSEVRCREKRLSAISLPAQDTEEICAIKDRWPKWKQKNHKICLVGDDGAICDGLAYNRDYGLLF